MAKHTHDLLGEILDNTKCFPGWYFSLVEDPDNEGSIVLHITIKTQNNYDPTKPFIVSHCHPVPMATYNEKTWQRWIFDQCMRSMTHEMGEALQFNGRRPFAPCHGPGFDPYVLHDNVTEEERRTMQDGSIRPIKKHIEPPTDHPMLGGPTGR